MAVPKRRLARSWRGNRRSHDHPQIPSPSSCPRCSQPKLPHRVCGNCGFYKGSQIVDMRKL